jgi:hypothetical protein
VLHFFYSDGILFANFDAALAAKALVFVHGLGFAVNQFVNVYGAYIDTFGIAGALVFVHSNLVRHS